MNSVDVLLDLGIGFLVVGLLLNVAAFIGERLSKRK